MSTWRPARSLEVLRAQINAAHPGRPTASDGMLASGAHHSANPTSDHEPDANGIVHAADFTSVDSWTPALVNALVASRDSRIKYLIYRQRIIATHESPWIWMPYYGTNPHTKHFHISVMAANADDTRPWHIGGDDMSAEDVNALEGYRKGMENRLNTRIGTLDRNNQERLDALKAELLAAIAASKPAGGTP